MTENSYVREARRRWPKYYVSGDGSFALVNSSLCSVSLYGLAIIAQQELNERTDAAFCTLYELKPQTGSKTAGPLRVTAETMEHRR
jgi:hypothetical protein